MLCWAAYQRGVVWLLAATLGKRPLVQTDLLAHCARLCLLVHLAVLVLAAWALLQAFGLPGGLVLTSAGVFGAPCGQCVLGDAACAQRRVLADQYR